MQQSFVSLEKLASLGWLPDGQPVKRTDHVIQGFRKKGDGKVMYGKLPLPQAESDQKPAQTEEN